jgi:hypothetical protein
MSFAGIMECFNRPTVVYGVGSPYGALARETSTGHTTRKCGGAVQGAEESRRSANMREC